MDEILEFLSGKPVHIKDMFRLGKYVHQTSTTSRPRPILIKLGTAWDRKLVLLRKFSLSNFSIKRLFLREDVSPNHPLRKGKSNGPTVTEFPSDSPVGSSSTTPPTNGDASPAKVYRRSIVGSASRTRNSLSPAACDAFSSSVSPPPVRSASLPPPFSSSSSSSSTVVSGSQNDHHVSA